MELKDKKRVKKCWKIKELEEVLNYYAKKNN